MLFSSRLNKALNDASRTQTELAAHLGISPQAVQQWCKEDGTTPRNKRIKDIANYLNVSHAWLITGDAQSVREPVRKRLESRLKAVNKNKTWLSFELNVERQNLNNWLIRNKIPEQHLFTAARLLECDPEWLASGVSSQLIKEPAGIYSAEVKEKISQLTTQQKQTLSNTSIDQMRAQLQSLSSEQQAIIQAMLESWAQPQRKD